MQWVFLVTAIWAALVELHTGTFYLAGVAAASLLTTLVGFWLRSDWLIVVFVALCAAFTVGVTLLRRRRGRATGLVDFDVGQNVTVSRAPGPHGRLAVRYRGTEWEAVMDDGSAPAPGDSAVIARKADKRLHLVLAAPPAHPPAHPGTMHGDKTHAEKTHPEETGG